MASMSWYLIQHSWEPYLSWYLIRMGHPLGGWVHFSLSLACKVFEPRPSDIAIVWLEIQAFGAFPRGLQYFGG
jgi:hypothetical protein